MFLGQAEEVAHRACLASSEFQCPKFSWVCEGIFLLMALSFLHLKSGEDRAPGVEDQVEQCTVMSLHCAGSTPTRL